LRVAFFAITALALGGLYASMELVKIHLGATYFGAGDIGLCGQFEGFGCTEVAQSGYSSIAGLPVAVLGQAYYVAVLIMAAIWRFKAETLPRIGDAILLSAGLSVLYSAFLGVISKVVVGKLCPYCLILYGVNLGLFVAAWLARPGGLPLALRELGGFLRSKSLVAAGGAMLVTTIGAQGVYATQARSAHARAEQVRDALNARESKHLDVPLTDSAGKGPADARAVLVEFSDFECPYCKRLALSLDQVAKRESDTLRVHFKHYPMDASCNPNIQGEMHKMACEAAVASVCAQRQGRFWPMHDKLFENNRHLSTESIARYATEIGLDPEAFGVCTKDPTALEQVKRDIAQGQALGIRGTPTWFLNGWQYVGHRKPDDLQALVHERAATQKKASPPPKPEGFAPLKPAAPQ
jgi:protein-disulfide isomerase/uncharacterized membrane protein